MPQATEEVPARQARLVIYTSDNLTVEWAAMFLTGLERAYNGLLILQYAAFPNLYTVFPNFLIADWFVTMYRKSPFGVDDASRLIQSGDRLRLGRVSSDSPGVWEFIGKLNPLETLRLALNDFREWRKDKDKDYRNDAESTRFRVENLLRQADVAGAWIENLKLMGATEAEVRELMLKYVLQPLAELGASVEPIEKVELSDEDISKSAAAGGPNA